MVQPRGFRLGDRQRATGDRQGDGRQAGRRLLRPVACGLLPVANQAQARGAARRFAVLNALASMAGVRRPVFVFCRLGWNEPTSTGRSPVPT